MLTVHMKSGGHIPSGLFPSAAFYPVSVHARHLVQSFVKAFFFLAYAFCAFRGQVIGGGDDMTINTRLVMQEMNEWFADDPLNPRDKTLGIEDDDDDADECTYRSLFLERVNVLQLYAR